MTDGKVEGDQVWSSEKSCASARCPPARTDGVGGGGVRRVWKKKKRGEKEALEITGEEYRGGKAVPIQSPYRVRERTCPVRGREEKSRTNGVRGMLV